MAKVRQAVAVEALTLADAAKVVLGVDRAEVRAKELGEKGKANTSHARYTGIPVLPGYHSRGGNYWRENRVSLDL